MDVDGDTLGILLGDWLGELVVGDLLGELVGELDRRSEIYTFPFVLVHATRPPNIELASAVPCPDTGESVENIRVSNVNIFPTRTYVYTTPRKELK